MPLEAHSAAMRSAQVAEARAGELAALAVRKYLDALCVYFWAATPLLQARARAAARGPAALGYAAASSCAAATKWPRDGPEASRSLPAAGRRLASEISALRSWPRDTSVHPCCVVCHDMRTQDGPVTCRYGIFLKFQDMARLGLRTGAADVWRVRAPGPAADGAGRVHVARAVRRADRAAQLLPLGHQRLH